LRRAVEGEALIPEDRIEPMIDLAAALLAISQPNPYIAPCSLREDANFFKRIDALPDAVLKDFQANAGKVANPGEPVNMSDVGFDPKVATAYWRYVLKIGDRWFITYRHGGIYIQDITVVYSAPRFGQISYVGAVSGDPCAAYDYFQGKFHFGVIEGWRKIDTIR
jgi:hypothetical protein